MSIKNRVDVSIGSSDSFGTSADFGKTLILTDELKADGQPLEARTKQYSIESYLTDYPITTETGKAIQAHYTQATANNTIYVGKIEDGETITEALNAVLSEESRDNWFHLETTKKDTADILEIAAALPANKIFGVSLSSETLYDAQQSNDIVSQLEALTYDRVYSVYKDNQSDYFESSISSNRLSKPIGTPWSSTTSITGQTADNISITQQDVLESKNCNYYVLDKGVPVFYPGIMASGRSIASEITRIELETRIDEGLRDLLNNENKLSYTDKDFAKIELIIATKIQSRIQSGALNPLDNSKDYEIIMPAISSISNQDKKNGVVPAIIVNIKIGDEIRSINVRGNAT